MELDEKVELKCLRNTNNCAALSVAVLTTKIVRDETVEQLLCLFRCQIGIDTVPKAFLELGDRLRADLGHPLVANAPAKEHTGGVHKY